jgi:hypothetical protein
MIQTKTDTDPAELLAFRANTMTGAQDLPLEVRRDLSVGDVTSSLVELLELPDGAWALRSDRGEFLDERIRIGDMIQPGETVTVTPRGHLGRG